MPINPVAVGDPWTAAYAMQLINQLNGANTVQPFQPTSNTDTPASPSVAPTTWINLGNITVPAWASSAVVSMKITGCFEIAAGTDVVTLKIGIGAALGSASPRLTLPTSPGRGPFVWDDLISSIATGSQALIVQATRVSGTSQYRVDANSYISANIAFLP